MSFNSNLLERGCFYTRPELALLWGYADFHALSRGVFTPRNARAIVLFVTRAKQRGLTPYQDRLSGDQLHWEGEKEHGTDYRIARAAENGEGI